MTGRRPFRAIIYAVCSAAVAAGAAQAASHSAILDLDTAVERTLERNPELVAMGYSLEAQEGVILQSGQKPSVQVGLMVENVLGSGDFSGAQSAETTLTLFWTLERGKRERRIDAARSSLSALEADVEIRRLDAAAVTARLFIEALGMQERLQQVDAAVAAASATAVAVAERVEAGSSPAADLARAEAEQAHIELQREDYEHMLATAKRQLAAQWGAREIDFMQVSGDIAMLPKPEPYAALLARVDQNPDIARYLSEQRLRQAEVRLAEAQTRPNWQLAASVRRLEQTNDQAFVADIVIPITNKNFNQGQVAAARARLAMAAADQEAMRLQIETQLFAMYQELQHSLHRVELLRDTILPRVESALRDTQRAYEAGRYAYMELRTVQNEVLAARMELVDASINAHLFVIEIERLTGTNVVPAAAAL